MDICIKQALCLGWTCFVYFVTNVSYRGCFKDWTASWITFHSKLLCIVSRKDVGKWMEEMWGGWPWCETGMASPSLLASAAFSCSRCGRTCQEHLQKELFASSLCQTRDIPRRLTSSLNNYCIFIKGLNFSSEVQCIIQPLYLLIMDRR